ncbi:sulfate ABC transporter permease subunit CysT [Methylomonas rapida]|jgi:sulfate ABC transporter, permease protein CysT|uniref:Sulfate transport system permease protein CysT n=1 Tax=Methylomonas rapida TaxID=2963939 RepID=A0ABY7GQA6_9GAMM|nr:sulfate ABC transporter permease subunit CysT [Methylomonas rapida]WAR46702.1 sulfate ABC transporter permease subunit CysT [Methylomonas rapida]
MPQSHIMPGFRPTLGFTLLYLTLIVLIPLSALLLKTLQLSPEQFWAILTNKRVLASFQVSFGASLLAAAIAAVLGFIIAWTLVRYPFPGKKLFDAIIDLPFALPTAVAGIVLATLYEPKGWIGQWITQAFGVQIAYKPAGIVVALIFIGLPFVVRTIEPVLQEFDSAMEEAAASLGANRWQAFLKVILPNILPSAITGFALAFARSVGEYGSVIFIAGNMPYVSEVVPLLIITKLEQYDYAGATAIGLIMLLLSFLLLLIVNSLQWWIRRRSGQL